MAILLCIALGACTSSEVSRTLGARCESKSDCDDRCLSGPDYPGGMCTLTCEDDGDCPGSARCIDEEGGVCLYDCEIDPDCEFLGVGWECKQRKLREDDQREALVCRGD